MSNKSTEDQKLAAYPWTARQRRQVKGRRLTRKQRRRATRNL